MNIPKYLIIHHSGGTDSNPLADSSNYTVEQCNNDHKVSFNMISELGYYVGYQYFIDKKGIVTQCRRDNEEGAHTNQVVNGKSLNVQSLGICLAGNFDATLPTDAQVASLTKLLKEKSAQYNIFPSNIVPHRTFAQKTCYGKKLADDWARKLVSGETVNNSKIVAQIQELLKLIK